MAVGNTSVFTAGGNLGYADDDRPIQKLLDRGLSLKHGSQSACGPASNQRSARDI
jgi:hypothetical protein